VTSNRLGDWDVTLEVSRRRSKDEARKRVLPGQAVTPFGIVPDLWPAWETPKEKSVISEPQCPASWPKGVVRLVDEATENRKTAPKKSHGPLSATGLELRSDKGNTRMPDSKRSTPKT